MIFFYISLSTYICFLILKFGKGIILLDSSKCNLKTYYTNIKKDFKDLFLTPELFGIVLIILAVRTNEKITGISFVIFYTLMFLYFLKKKKGKINIKKNASIIVIISCIFIFVNSLFCLNYLTYEEGYILFYTALVLFSYFSYLVILIAELINKPIELILSKKHKL